MKLFGVSINELEFGDRLVPTYYFYTKVLKEENISQGIEYFRLGEKCTISDGEHSAIPRNNIRGVRYLYGRNIKEGVIDFDPISDDSYITQADYESFNRCHISQNDVLIAIYGTVGKSAVYKEEYVGIAGIPRHIANITLHSDCPVTSEYLTAFFRSKFGKWQIDSVTTGNIQQLLSLKNLRAFEIPLAPDATMKEITRVEQEAIACEIAAEKLIKEAQDILYKSLNFDVASVTRDRSFSVRFSEVNSTNIWSTSFYDKLYVKMGEALKRYSNAVPLGDLVSAKHGDEVGSDQYKLYVDRNDEDYAFVRTSDIVNNEADLFPDYYITPEIYEDIKQDIRENDVLFTKDGKIGCVGLVVEADNIIISSGIERLRLNEEAKKLGLTQEYLFTALSIPEVGRYGAKRRTVIASTIPHLREERLKEIEIPIASKDVVDRITKLIKEAFSLKNTRKVLLTNSSGVIDKMFL